MIDRLAGRAPLVAVATHDPCLARAARVPARIYVPYGAAWVPYCLSQVRQNPRLLWWALRDATLGASGGLVRQDARSG